MFEPMLDERPVLAARCCPMLSMAAKKQGLAPLLGSQVLVVFYLPAMCS